MRETPKREKVVPVSGTVATSPRSLKVTLRGFPLSVKDVVSAVLFASAPMKISGPMSLLTSSWLGKWSVSRITSLIKSAAPGSNHRVAAKVPLCGEIPSRAINQISAAAKGSGVTVREVVPLGVVKSAVSDVEEFSVMTRVSIAPARIGCVTSAAMIAIISAGNIFRVDLDIIFLFLGMR